jgi:hypothetical protein
MPLSDIEPEDRPWLIEAYPAVAERMGIERAPPPFPSDRKELI